MLKEARFYRFGEYSVDAGRRVLLKQDTRVALTPKAFDVLLALVQRQGQVVTKQELLRTVWSDTVVEEVSLTRNISVLRKALGETPDQHNYIVTIPGTGYRFVAPVESVPENPASEPAPQSTPHPPLKRSWTAPIAIFVVAVTGIASWVLRPSTRPALLRGVPFTTYPGSERSPALSPDGGAVAFTWDGESQDNVDVYVKALGSSGHRRLTTNAAEDLHPAWSPDGRTIAFVRRMKDDRMEIILVPAQGGAERRIAETTASFMVPPSLTWSPDGRSIVVTDAETAGQVPILMVVSVAVGPLQKRRLGPPPEGPYLDQSPVFSPDGRQLAFSRVSNASIREIYVLSPADGSFETAPARRLTNDGRIATNPAWTADGRHLLYVFSPAGSGESSALRMIDIAGTKGSWQVPLAEDAISEISLGRHLVYSRIVLDTNIWRADASLNGATSAAPQRLIASTRLDGSARYSPDGRNIAFISNRSGGAEIWIAGADGSNAVKLTSFNGPSPDKVNWSPDGRRLVFHSHNDAQADIYAIPISGGTPERLTHHPSDDASPSYSHDGRWIYFSSWRSGYSEIWKMPAGGGDAAQVTHSEGAYTPVESPDGKTLYYCNVIAGKGVSKMALPAGEPVQVTGPLHQGLCGLDVTERGIYYTAAPDGRGSHSIRFLDFASGAERTIVTSPRPLASISVSPDRKSVIYVQFDESGSDLMLIENFAVP